VAARYLARRDSASIGLLGCGVQAEVQLEALRLLFPIRRVLVWGSDARELELFVRRQRARGIVGVQSVSTVRQAVEVADILVTTLFQITFFKGDFTRILFNIKIT
jgi:ornithine cyclodeaminase